MWGCRPQDEGGARGGLTDRGLGVGLLSSGCTLILDFDMFIWSIIIVEF